MAADEERLVRIPRRIQTGRAADDLGYPLPFHRDSVANRPPSCGVMTRGSTAMVSTWQ
jgi:hypothetical protein